ncbi:hypothetical protein COL922a_014093, partial [Colletotrichum nupharicola]
ILDNYWGPGTRTLVFFAAGIQAFATFVTNLTSNSIPVGCDLAGLFPRFFTIVGGQVVCFLLAWVCDYYLIRRGNIHIPSLYTAQKATPYYYTSGFNIRAFISWAAAIALVIPGVSGALNPGSIGTAAVRIYDLGFLISTSVAGALYWVL